MFLESAFIPCAHGLKAVLLLEEGVNGFHTQAVIDDGDGCACIFAASCKDNSSQLGALFFKLTGLGNSVWEVAQDELVAALNSRVDDFFEHFHDQAIHVALRVFSSGNLSGDLATNARVSVTDVRDQREDIELFEVFGALKLVNDLLALIDRVSTATGSHKEDSRLNAVAQLLKGLLEVLLGVDALKVRA